MTNWKEFWEGESEIDISNFHKNSTDYQLLQEQHRLPTLTRTQCTEIKSSRDRVSSVEWSTLDSPSVS